MRAGFRQSVGRPPSAAAAAEEICPFAALRRANGCQAVSDFGRALEPARRRARRRDEKLGEALGRAQGSGPRNASRVVEGGEGEGEGREGRGKGRRRDRRPLQPSAERNAAKRTSLGKLLRQSSCAAFTTPPQPLQPPANPQPDGQEEEEPARRRVRHGEHGCRSRPRQWQRLRKEAAARTLNVGPHHLSQQVGPDSRHVAMTSTTLHPVRSPSDCPMQTLAVHFLVPRALAAAPARGPGVSGPQQLPLSASPPHRSRRLLRPRQNPQGCRRSHQPRRTRHQRLDLGCPEQFAERWQWHARECRSLGHRLWRRRWREC